MQLSPSRYRAITVVALVLLVIIVVTGAAVRLTGSGLGCDDWPNCNDQRLVDVSTAHAAIEQVNRLFTGLVAFGVIAAVLGSLWRVPHRRDLVWLSVGLVAGVLGQVVLGGITVLVDLHPIAVQSHLLLSMVLVGTAVVLVDRAGREATLETTPPTPRSTERWLAWAVAAATAVAIVTGTVVTGAGPHAGDEDVRRLAIDISAAARAHSASVLVAIALAVALAVLMSRRGGGATAGAALSTWIAVALLQAALGYTQYFSDVPPLLVGLHVLGATLLWAATVHLVLVARRPGVTVTVGTTASRRLVASRNT